jgi:hypothetical protein
MTKCVTGKMDAGRRPRYKCDAWAPKGNLGVEGKRKKEIKEGKSD